MMTTLRTATQVRSSSGRPHPAVRGGHGVATIVPVTSTVARTFPFRVLLPADEAGLRVGSEARAEQVGSRGPSRGPAADPP